MPASVSASIASNMAEPVVVVSSRTATTSSESTGPTIRPPVPWSLASFLTEKARSGRPPAAAAAAVATAIGSAPIVNPPTAVTSGSSTSHDRFSDEDRTRTVERCLARVDVPIGDRAGAQRERTVGAHGVAHGDARQVAALESDSGLKRNSRKVLKRCTGPTDTLLRQDAFQPPV